MNRENRLQRKWQPDVRFPLMLVMLVLLAGCASDRTLAGDPNALSPGGPAAASIASLWWLMFAMGMLVILLVTALTVYAVTARRRRQPDPGPGEIIAGAPDSRTWIWYGGILLPAVMLPIVAFATLNSLNSVGRGGSEPEVTYEIIGRQWFWEVYGPDRVFESANELHIPTGVPIRLSLTSADVIHSFWVPDLHGKIDLIPGRTNEFWIQADEPGLYRGFCAEFCGLQHAHMQFIVVAESQEEYDRWVEGQSREAAEPEGEMAQAGLQVFMETGCAACHAIRGTQADGDIGPDLTHLASRRTIAAGALENNRANLGGWIANPQHIKPGNNMPIVPLRGEELQALLVYLEGLE